MRKFYSNHKLLLCLPILIFLVSLGLIVGWYYENGLLTRLTTNFISMNYETALIFCLLAAALAFSLVHRIHISNIISIFILVITALILTNYLFDINLGLDQIIFKHYVVMPNSYPSHMAPITAICFIFCSLTLLSTNHAKLITYDKFAYTGLVISFLNIGINSVALVGYIFKTRDFYGCGAGGCMALLTVIAFLVWNLGFIIWFKNTFKQAVSGLNLFILSISFTGIVIVFILVSQTIAKNEYHELIESKKSFEERIVKNFKELIKLKVQAVELFALHMQLQDKISNQEWLQETNSHSKTYEGMHVLVLFDKNFNKVFEKKQLHSNITYPNQSNLIQSHESTAYLTDAFKLTNDDSAFWIIIPVINKNSEVIYYAASLVLYNDIFDVLLTNRTKLLYKLELFNANNLVYKSNNEDLDHHLQLLDIINIETYNQKMQVAIEPTPMTISLYRSFIPEIVLILGVITSFLIYLIAGALMSMQKKSKQLKLLFSGTKAIFESPTTDQAIRSCIISICEIIGWDVGHAYYVTKTIPAKLVPANIWYFKNYKNHQAFYNQAKNREFYSGESLPGRVLQSSDLVWVDNIEDDKNFLKYIDCRNLNLKSAIGFPIVCNSTVVIVLEFFNTKKIKPDPSFMAAIGVLSENLSKTYAKRELEDLLNKKTTELEEYNRHIVSLAYKDPLTNLLNRRAFEEEATRKLAFAKRHQITTAILYTDLDKFKEINDRHGHETGDLLLVAISNVIQSVTRTEDLVARFGGDEFVIFLSHLNNDYEAQSVAEKIIDQVLQPMMINNNRIYPSISIGIKICAYDEELSESIRAADKALYKSKLNGRAQATLN